MGNHEPRVPQYEAMREAAMTMRRTVLMMQPKDFRLLKPRDRDTRSCIESSLIFSGGTFVPKRPFYIQWDAPLGGNPLRERRATTEPWPAYRPRRFDFEKQYQSAISSRAQWGVLADPKWPNEIATGRPRQ